MFTDLGKLSQDEINQITDASFSAMTSDGDVKLDFHIYKLCFLNFLLGRQPNGPGQFIFGTVKHKSGKNLFAIDYSVLTKQESDEKIETYSVEKLAVESQRKSIVV